MCSHSTQLNVSFTDVVINIISISENKPMHYVSDLSLLKADAL